MKKSLLFFSSILVGAMGMNAQITITTADVSAPFKMIQQAHDSVPTVTPGSGGPSQTWNLSTLNTSALDTLEFLPPSFAPHATQFPTSNLAIHFYGNNAWGYLINSSGSLTILGQSAIMDFGGGPSDIVQKNTPAEILANFPSTYMTNFANNFTSDGTFYAGIAAGPFTIDSLRRKSVITKTNNVDGWGSVTTPLGTFAALRFFEVKYNTDTTWVCSNALGGWQTSGPLGPQVSSDSTKTYSWWANGIGFPLVQMNLDSTMAVKTVDWLKATPTTGVNEYTSDKSIMVYPNPAQSEIHFGTDASKVTSIQIFDIAGRMIDAVEVSSDISTYSTSKLANGAYTYSVIGRNNNTLDRGKFTIAK
jgi:hypothetical protein